MSHINKIEWTAPEFTKYEKDKKWFVVAILIACVIIIIAIFSKNFLLVLATILTIFIVYIYSVKKPRKIKFRISGQGIQIDNQIYDFENLKSFWIFYSPASPAGGPPEVKELSFRSKKTFLPYIKIPLADQDPVKIREFLLKFLPEKKHHESIVDEWARKLRF